MFIVRWLLIFILITFCWKRCSEKVMMRQYGNSLMPLPHLEKDILMSITAGYEHCEEKVQIIQIIYDYLKW